MKHSLIIVDDVLEVISPEQWAKWSKQREKTTMNDEPILSLEDAKEVVKNKPFPKITEATIKDKIAEARYLTDDTTTICILVMMNGFKFVGTSTPASPQNYDADVGKRYAFENAFKQIWTHEGYRLRQELYLKELTGE
jgi:hypothetical protein